MARLRFTLEQARAEASRRAVEYVYGLPHWAGALHRGTFPDGSVPLSRSSKHPTAWITVFAFEPPEGATMDGGELFIAVNLETGVVSSRL